MHMRPSEKAWIALAAGVIVYEIVAEDGEMLSHAVDSWLKSHPIITTSAISLTALHLLNVLPKAIDPWHWAFGWRKWVK